MNRTYLTPRRLAKQSTMLKDIAGVSLIVGVIAVGVAGLYWAHGVDAEAADLQEMGDGAICRPMKEDPRASLCERTVRYIVTSKGRAVYLDEGAQ